MLKKIFRLPLNDLLKQATHIRHQVVEQEASLEKAKYEFKVVTTILGLVAAAIQAFFIRLVKVAAKTETRWHKLLEEFLLYKSASGVYFDVENSPQPSPKFTKNSW
ncbi:MAG: hypothetical protein PWP65_26 [Clostridia bacterium]|nr:hypothetical protein [Clostridia bacterium]